VHTDPDGKLEVHIITNKKAEEAVQKIPEELQGLKDILKPAAKVLDKLLHHQILPKIPGDMLIKPELDFKRLDIKEPDLDQIEYEIFIQYTIRF